MTTNIRALVIEMAEHSDDIILGQIWLKRHKVILDYKNQVAVVYKNKKKFILKPVGHPKPEQPKSKPDKVHLCTIKTAKRALQRGQQIYLCVVKTADNKTEMDPEIQKVLDKYPNLCPVDLPELAPLRPDLPPVIQLVPGAKPAFRNRGRYSMPEKDEMQRQIEAGIKAGRVRPSHSPWGASVLFVPKSSGRGLRMCVDYRALNSLTIKNRFPLPRIDDLLDQLSGAKYLSSLDLLHGYYQVRMNPEEIPMTAFTTPFGLYEFTVMPFGLTNAPSVFQSMMQQVLSPLLYKGVMVYLDDIIIYSKNKEEHLELLDKVFKLLNDNKLFVCLEKSHFMMDELKYLGHIVTPEGLKVDHSKTQAVHDMVPPRNQK
jgi:hypothetical protein